MLKVLWIQKELIVGDLYNLFKLNTISGFYEY